MAELEDNNGKGPGTATVKKAAPKKAVPKKAAKKKAPAKKATGKKATPKKKEIKAVFVKTKPGIKSFRRAGHAFNYEGHGIALDALSKEQLEQLEDEDNLIVEPCTICDGEIVK